MNHGNSPLPPRDDAASDGQTGIQTVANSSAKNWQIAAIALIIAFIAAFSLTLRYCQRYIEFTISFPGTSWVHLYPSKGGEAGHLKYKGVRVESSGRPTAVRIPLLPISMDALLLRLENPGGVVSVRDIRLVNGRGDLLATIGRSQLENSAASSVAEVDGGVNLSPTGLSKIIDMRLNFDKTLEPVPDGAVTLFLKTFFPSLVLVTLLIGGGVRLCGRKLPDSDVSPAAENPAEKTGVLALAGVFLIILGSRWWLIHSFGSELPFWDQWGAEATYLYLPYFRGALTLGDLFAPHNEHHIFLTKLVSLGLLLLNGTWDPLLQMALNALLYASVGVFVLRSLMASSSPLWSASVALLFSLPFGWQNTLGGFQLQMYLLIGLSLLFLWFMTCAASPWWRWLGGGSCAVLLLFTMASGFLACTAFLCMVLLLSCKQGARGRFRTMLPAMMLCLGVTVAGMLMKVTVPEHLALQAETAGGFAEACAAYLGWPLTLFPILGAGFPGARSALFFSALLLWLPFLTLTHRFRKELDPSPRLMLLVAIGFWTILQVAAAAYARGSNIFPSSRYQDYFAIGLLVNIASLHTLRDVLKPGKGAVAFFLTALLWGMGSAAGLLFVTGMNAVHDLPEKRAQQEAGLEHVRTFIATGDSDTLTGKPRYDIPHHDTEKLARLLADADIRRILTPTVTGSGEPGRFKPLLGPLLASGPLIAGTGAILFAVAMIRRRKRGACGRS